MGFSFFYFLNLRSFSGSYDLANSDGVVVPHAAFCDPRYPAEEPRESVELRVLVVY